MFFISSFHNAYLEIWYNTGFLGLSFFVISQVLFIYGTFRMAFANHDIEIRAAGLLALGYMIGFVLMCMYESIGAAASSVNVLLYLFLGYMVSLNYQPEQIPNYLIKDSLISTLSGTNVVAEP